jgi:ABC-2 type transport system ATP-binding protein
MLAVAHKPQLLLLDELSTGLDIESREEMKQIIRKQLDELNATLLLVSHNPDEIEFLTNRVVVLNGGLIFEDIMMSDIKRK